MSKDTSTGFSVSAAKALFEAAKKPEVRNAAIAAAKNPFVRQTAKNVAQDEKARGAVLNAVKDPSASNKFSAAFAVHDANKNQKPTSSSGSSSTYAPPPPPPHRGASSSLSGYSSISRAVSSKLSSSHAAIRSQLENLHLGGHGSTSATTSTPSESAASYSYQKSTPSATFSTPPPPLPNHSSHAPFSSSSNGLSFKPTSEPHAIAQYSYSAAQADEVSLNVGDTFLLKKNVDDQWIYGENQTTGQMGIAPLSYLQIIIPLSNPNPPRPAPPSSSKNHSQINATALYDYNSTQPGDLVFSANQSIVVTNRINDEWLEGEANGKHGIFPSNFVTCSRLYEVPVKGPVATQSFSDSGKNETVTVAFAYNSGISGDLQCNEGDLISIIEDIDAQWIMGEHHGQRGLIPKTFLGPPFGSPKHVSKGIAEISSAFSPKKGIAIGDYHSEDPKHLYVTRGDNLLIVEDVDEYYYRGKLESFKTLPAGILPKNVVQLSK